MPYRVLFVCSGNICRSPMAESIFKRDVRERGLEGKLEADSAGTGSWHVGEMPNPRTILTAGQYGCCDWTPARQIQDSDFREFNLIIAMDRGHMLEMKRMRSYDPEKVKLMMDYAPGMGYEEVPDPYYGELDGFEKIYTMLNAACRNLIDDISKLSPTA